MKKAVISWIFILLAAMFSSQMTFAQSDSAMSLTTSSQYAHYGNVITTNDDVTMEAWVYWSGSTGANQLIFYNGNTSTSGYGLMISYTDADMLSLLCGGVVLQSTGRTLTQNAWNHIALTKHGNEFIIYLNGTPENAYVFGNAFPSGDFMVGGNSQASESFKGYIDEVRVWNTARTSSEIFKNASAALTGSEPGLVALYHFDDDRGAGTIADAGTNGFNLTTNGNPEFVLSTASAKLLRQQVSVAYSGGTSATVKWLKDPHSSVNKYVVYRDEAINPTTYIGETAGPDDTTFTDNTINPNAVYYYTVRAAAVSVTDTSDYYRPTAVSTYPDAGNAGSFTYGPFYIMPITENIPTGNSSYTLEAWIKPSGMGDYGIVGWGEYGNYSSVNALRLYNNGIHHYWWANDLSIETGDISGSWHHVAVTYDGTTRKIYLDGVLKASDNPGTHTVPYSSGLTIGNTNGIEYFYGAIDELRIWNVARTESEITTSASSPLTGQEIGLVSLYHFDESDGQYLLDQAGGNHGFTSNGMAGRTESGALKIFPPYSVFAVPGNQQVEFTWSPSISPNILRYELYYGIGQNGEPTFLDTAAANETSRVISSVDGGSTPLTNDQVYLFAVRAVDTDGNVSDFGNHLEAVPTVKAGNALGANGDGSFANVSHHTDFNFVDSVTIMAWIKTSDGSERYITTKTEDSWYLAINGGNYGNDGKVSFWLNGPSNSPGWIHSATRVDDGQWHHVAATYDGFSLKIYIDGYLSTDVPAYGTIYTGSNYVQIGARNGGQTFNGEMDELSFWKRTLDLTEIRPLISVPIRGDETGLVALYHFNEPDFSNYSSDGVHNMHNANFSGEPFVAVSGAMGVLSPYAEYAIAGDQQVEFRWKPSISSNIRRYDLYYAQGQNGELVFYDSAAVGDTSRIITTYQSESLLNGEIYLFAAKAVDIDGNESNFSNIMQAVPTVKAGKAVSLDGYDYVSLPTILNQPSALTITAWFNASATGDQIIFYHGEGGELQLKLSSGAISAQVKLNDYNWHEVNSPFLINANEWYHAAMTWTKGGSMKLYLNGHLIGMQTVPDYDLYSPGGYYTSIGSYNQGSGSLWSGLIDEVSIWNQELTQSQIRSNIFLPYRGDETGLIALYHLDEPTADNITADNVHNIYNGNFNGEAPSMVVSGAMEPPFAPGGLTATPDTGRVTLRWAPNFESGFKHYRIFVSDTSDFSNVIRTDSTALNNVNDTTKVVSGLTNFETYYFRLTAVLNDGSEGGFSPIVEATPTIFKNEAFTFPDMEDKNAAWGDYDDDGDYDLLVVGGNSHYGGCFATIYKNTGGSFTEQSLGFEATAWATSASWCDYNNDGRLDVSYMGATGNGNRIFKLYQNNGDGTFTDIPTAIQGIAKGWMSWFDFDNDGDQDVVLMGDIGDQSGTLVYKNNGNGNFTQIDAGLTGLQRGSMAWADYDKDGDMDLLMVGSTDAGNYGRSVFLYRNDGNGGTSWADVTNSAFNTESAEGVVAGACAFGDLNNDGYPDIVYTGGTGGARTFKVYYNNGDGSFTDQEVSLTGVTKGLTSLGDFDNDGDLDILVAGENTSGSGNGYLDYVTYIARNDGGGSFTMLNAGTDQVGGYYRINATGGWNDFDRDGDLDILVGGENRDAQNVVKLYRNISGGTKNTAPSDPSFAGMNTTTSFDTVWFSWSPSNDNGQTPDNGLTYNLRVGSASAQVDVMSPLAKVTGSALGGGFRYVFENGNVSNNTSWRLDGLADGTYYWSVEAIDQIYRNSKFQQEKSFTIDGAPSAPIGLIASAGVNSANLQWSSENKSDVSKYYIYASVNNDTYFLADSTATTSKTVTTIDGSTPIQNGTVYYFYIIAKDQNGYLGPNSDIASALPSATPGKWFVTHDGDDGQGGTLREMIDSTNLSTQSDTILFLLPRGSVIQLNSGLPQLSTGRTVIDGDSNADGTPDIQVLNGWYDDAFTISSSNNTIKGLVIGSNYSTGGGGSAITISGSDAHDNLILGNYIGTNQSGMSGETGGRGIWIGNTAHDNWIGDGTASGRNVISGNNSYGIRIDGSNGFSDNNKILGNIIGVTADGLTGLSNSGPGIYIYHKARNTQIGNATVGGRNIISGNSGNGIELADEDGLIQGTSILGNYIGTDITGLIGIGNSSIGIYFNGYSYGRGEASIIQSQIGNGTAAGRSVISGNGSTGIYFDYANVHHNVIDGNYIGVAANGDSILSNGYMGIYTYESSDNTISNNVISGNNGNGIHITTSSNNVNNTLIKGNKIGTNATGAYAIPNNGYGIHLQGGYSGSTNNTVIGGTTAADRNIISGNYSSGISLGEGSNGVVENTQILGNYIGTDATGTMRIANQGHGIYIYNYNDRFTSIGNATAGGRNVISGNAQSGIWLEYTSENTVYGNYVGVDATGNAALSNDSCGIVIWNSSFNRIGNGSASGRNVVSANGMEGIEIYAGFGGYANDNYLGGNHIGVGADGTTALGNVGHGVELEALDVSDVVAFDTLTANIIAYNGENGIQMESMANPGGGEQGLQSEGGGEIRVLDKGPSQSGANNNPLLGNRIFLNNGKGIALENYANNGVLSPVISSVSNFVVTGTGIIGATVEVYQDTDDEGESLIGTATVDGSGNWTIAHNVFPGLNITAIQDSAGNTSEFSSPMTVVSGTLVSDVGSLNFGNILYGSTDSLTVKVWAVGNPTFVSGASIVTANFTFTGSSLADTLFLNDTMQFKVKFHPTNFGTFTDTLLFQSSGGDLKIALSGTGLPGILTATASNYAFGNVYLGDSASFTMRFYMLNGSADVYSLTTNNESIFSATASPLPPGRIGPGDTTVVTVKFKPNTLGALHDTIRFVNNTSGSPFQVVLSGSGIPGVLGTTASAIAFGNVQVGDSVSQTVKLYAQFGDISLTSASLPITQLSFTVTPVLPAVLHKGDTAEFTIQYKPDAFTPLVDTLRVFNSSLVSPFSVPVSGNGAGGNLGADAFTMNFGTVIVGDSVMQQVKLYSTFGLVAVNNAFMSSGTQYSVSVSPVLPQNIQSGDTLIATVKFKPTVATVINDTANFSNNSSVNPLQIALSGTGRANAPPNAFSLKPVTDKLTNDLTPTLSWQNTGDADMDALVYDLVVSKNSNLSSPVVNVTGINDSSFTTTSLDTVSLYYFRVTARDPRGGSTSSNIDFFRTDGKRPTVALGVLQLKAIKKDIQVYVATNEVLSSRSISFNLNGTVDNSKTLSLVPGQTKIYQTDYTLTAAGTLVVSTSGTDSAGNTESNASKSYTIGSLSKGDGMNLVFGDLAITALKGTVSEEGYLLATMIDRAFDEHLSKELGKTSTLSSAQEALKIVELISTVDLKKGIEIKVSYDEVMLNDLRGRYAGFDERKIGLYKEEADGSYTYLGGQGSSGVMTARTQATGRLVLMYDDTRDVLPQSVELSQNYPNPFNPTTTIRYGVPQGGRVKLVVYNVLGQKVTELVNKSQEAGYYEIVWDGRNSRQMQVSSGIYLYRLETSQGVVTRKMTFLK